MESQNMSTECQDNQTDPLMDASSHLFLSILPYEHTVPVLVWTFVLLTFFSCLINAVTLSCIGESDDPSWQPRFAFYRSLIFSDLLQIFTTGPSVIHMLIQRRTIQSGVLCYLQYFLTSVSIFSSLCTITCMTLERYLYICYAMQYLSILSQTRQRLVLSLIWLYSISIGVINLSLLLVTGRAEENNQATTGLFCEPDNVEQHVGSPRAPTIFRKVAGFLTLLLCLLVHAFSYIRMYQEARDAMMPFKAANVKARRTVMFYTGMLFFQLLPVLMKVISDLLWEFRGEWMSESEGACRMKAIPSTLAAALHVALLITMLLPPCINPLVYGLRNLEIRKALVNLCRWMVQDRNTEVLPMQRIRNGNVSAA